MIIAIDVGGTKISAALMNDGEIIEQRKIESVIHSDLANLAQHLINLCHDWIAKAELVAIACTGQVGSEYVNFLSAKKKLPLKSQLEASFNRPVFIINDAAAAAWAEYCVIKVSTKKAVAQDTNKSDETLVYITVSTGIGGGMVQNGQLVTSTDGFCAHLGHTSVQHIGQQSITCHCGRVNCAEAIASGTAIAKQASKILNKNVSCKEVFQQYINVPEISQLIDQCTSAITDLIANVKATTGTQKVILGGSVGSAPLFTQQVTEKIALLPDIYQLSVQSPQCGADADLIGAYYYALQMTTHSKNS
jgi:N-acylmannosamine kinase